MKTIKITYIKLHYLFFSLIFFILSSCGSEIEDETKATFQVTTPLKKDTVVTNEYVCQIKSIQHIELRAFEKGYLQKIYVDEGQFVKAGQLMFQIMPAIYKAELQKVQAEVSFAEIEYQNTKQLSDSNIVSKNELALVKAKLDKAKAELLLAQTHLSFTEIHAPFDGIMDHFYVRLGSLVEEGDLLTTLSDNSQMWVYFNVPEVEYLNFMKKYNRDNHAKVHLKLANGDVFDEEGYVETIEADFNSETGNIAFRATFKNPDGILRHGETGNILMRDELKNALLIPQKTAFEVLDKKYVYIIDKRGLVKTREIIVGHEMPHLYSVTDGVDENERILLDGLRKVRENDKINFKLISPQLVFENLNLYAE
jgi:membrane fusion protein (multidrug efflux system)